MRHPCSLILACSFLLTATSAHADAFLVRDLATAPTSGEGTRDLDALELDGVLYFRGADPRTGSELWRSDGTAGGTRLFADLCPGPCDSTPRPVAVLGGALYWVADDGVFGDELWVTDGTRPGTRLVRDVCAGPCGSSGGRPPSAAVLGDRLVFAADDGETGLEPWITDGTRLGTRRIADLCEGSCGSLPADLAAAGGRVFFRSDDGPGSLWVSDGTVAGTRKVVDPCFDCLPRAAAGGRLVFSRELPARGTELWTSDGTAAGTGLLLDACPGPCDGSLDRFSEVATSGGTVYFVARSDAAGTRALWRSDGTSGGTVRVVGEPEFHAVAHLTPVAGGLAFATFNDTFDRATLWWTDGSATFEIIDNLRVFFAVFDLAATADRIYYVTYTPNFQGRQLWTHDGSQGTMLRVFLPPPGSNLLAPAITALTPLGGSMVFKAFEEEVGWEPWSSDGTRNGTARLADLDADPGSSRPRRLAGVGERVLFVADADGGTAVLRSDGTLDGTTPLGAGPPSTLAFGALDGRLLFASESGASAEDGLWSSDGTTPGTDFLADGAHAARSFVESGGRLFFSADGLGGDELWTSDGTAGGSGLVVDLTPGLEPSPILPCCPRSTRPHDLVEVDGGIYFGAATGPTTGSDDELWKSDGSAAGTVRIRDLCDGECSSTPRELVRLGELVFFTAEDPEAGRELWRSDGSAAGTRRVLDLREGPASSDPHDLFVLGDRLYFFAHGPRIWLETLRGRLDRSRALGESLWSTDGTAAGTERVHELRVAKRPSWVLGHETVGARTFFVVANEIIGPELWVSDGTTAGTGLVADVRPGPVGSYPASLTAVDGLLVFTADDGDRGAEAWVSDGTAGGTRLLADLEAGEGSSRPADFVAAGDFLLMSAETPGAGRELWAIERAALPGTSP